MIKKRNLRSLLFLCFFISLFACSTKEKKKENVLFNVEIEDALQKKLTVKLSDFIDGAIEYVRLDSEKEYLLGKHPRFFLSGNEIFAFSRGQIFVFDRKTGKFLREIGHYGNDPGGYKKVLESFPFDEEKQLVYAGDWDGKSYCRYSADGHFLDKITVSPADIKEDMVHGIFGEIITSIAPLNDTCFVGYVWNINGSQDVKLIVFNEKNHRIKTFSQNKHFDYDINRDGITVYSWNAKYYQFNHHLHFFERFSDTVYSVSPVALQAKYVLRKGDTEHANATGFTQSKGKVKYLLIENLFESDRYLFFKIKKPADGFEGDFYYGVFDKKNKSTKIAPEIANDVNDFIPFNFISANQNNEIVGYCDAYEVKLWFEENPEKAAKLSSGLQKLRDVKENDNSVVMIAKLKK